MTNTQTTNLTCKEYPAYTQTHKNQSKRTDTYWVGKIIVSSPHLHNVGVEGSKIIPFTNPFQGELTMGRELNAFSLAAKGRVAPPSVLRSFSPDRCTSPTSLYINRL